MDETHQHSLFDVPWPDHVWFTLYRCAGDLLPLAGIPGRVNLSGVYPGRVLMFNLFVTHKNHPPVGCCMLAATAGMWRSS